MPCSGSSTGGLAYWVAVLRETFEEAGLLLAERPGGPALLAGDPEEEARFVAERAAVNAGTRRFLDLCREEGLRLMVGDVHYFAHWITPRGAPRRFDTRFFVAAAPPGQHAAHDAGETIAETWISPRRALAAHRAGDFELIFPTIRNLQAISRFTSAGDLLEAAALASGAVPTIEPRVVADGNGVRIVLPGDDGYDENRRPVEVALAVSEVPGNFNDAVRPSPWRRTRRTPLRDPRCAGPRRRPGTGAGPTGRTGRRAAPPHRAQPGAHDRSGYQHLSIGRRIRVELGRGRSRVPTTTRIGPPSWRRRRPWGRSGWVLVTHTHPDHAPGAAALAEQTGAEVDRLRAGGGVRARPLCGRGLDAACCGAGAAAASARESRWRRCTRPGMPRIICAGSCGRAARC